MKFLTSNAPPCMEYIFLNYILMLMGSAHAFSTSANILVKFNLSFNKMKNMSASSLTLNTLLLVLYPCIC